MCRKCKGLFHGEMSKCSKVNDLKKWARNVSGNLVRNCPNCKVLIEKDEGCPKMTCGSCHYGFCWICGLSGDSLFHWF